MGESPLRACAQAGQYAPRGFHWPSGFSPVRRILRIIGQCALREMNIVIYTTCESRLTAEAFRPARPRAWRHSALRLELHGEPLARNTPPGYFSPLLRFVTERVSPSAEGEPGRCPSTPPGGPGGQCLCPGGARRASAGSSHQNVLPVSKYSSCAARVS